MSKRALVLPQSDPWPTKVVGQTPMRHWLQTRGSLTAKLRTYYPSLQVQLLRQAWLRMHPAEQVAMRLPARQQVWQREVCLQSAGLPRVFAHSILSAHTLRGPWHRLRTLGTRPLGEVLFKTATIRRSRLHVKKLPRQHPLRMRVLAAGLATPDTVLWARRSRFQRGHGLIMVTEVFLPACLDAGAQV